MFLVAAAVSIFILSPLLIVVWKSFQVEYGLRPAVYSLKNYSLLVSPRTIAAIVNSIIIAAGSAPLAGLMGVTLAWIVARTNTPLRGVFETWNLVPFFTSPLLGAIAWSYLGSPQIGLLNKAFMAAFHLSEPPINIYSYGGIIWVLGLFHTPFVYLFCIGTLRQMDPSLEQAARVCGSNEATTLLRITLPLASPAILSSLILVFVLGIEELGTTLVLGYPHGIQTISIQIYETTERYPPNYNFGAALGILLVFITGAGILLQRHILASRSFTTVTGKGYRPQQLDLGRTRYVTLAVNLLYLTVAVALPIGTLVAVSFSRAWLGYLDPTQFSTQYFVYLATRNPIAIRGIRNSLILAIAGATLAMTIATVIAYIIHRTKSRARSWLDVVTTLPIGIPGLVLAIGLFVALIRTPLYGTLWILLLGYTIRFFTYGQRTISAVLVSVSVELEEASQTSGANWSTTMRRILLPLMRPGVVAGWLLLFITFMREVSMSLLLSRSGTETLSAALYSLLLYDPVGAAAAFTLVQVIMILAAAVLFLRISDKENIKI
jgi:iron(III) transport system permease protein